MPLSLLKRSRDSPPWSGSFASSATADDEYETGSGGSGSGYGSGTDTNLTSPTSATSSRRERLHGLISRPFRSPAGRALTSVPQREEEPTPITPRTSLPPPPRRHQVLQKQQQPPPPPQPPHTLQKPPSQHFQHLQQHLQQHYQHHQRQQSSAARTTASTATNATAPARMIAVDKPDSPPWSARLETAPLLSPPSRSTLINANKPLPSPPLPGSELDIGPPAKPVLRLDRIMATLTDDDIEKLFSGAPQYFARSEGHYTGAPHPSIAYPWDDALGIRDLTDHVQIEDEAWSSVTAWPHITRRSSPRVDAADAAGAGAAAAAAVPAEDQPPIKRRGHFYPRCRERPSMLSMQGLEKGTIGYEAALELSVADALQEEQFGFDSLGSRPAAIIEARRRLMDPLAAAAAAPASPLSPHHTSGAAASTDTTTTTTTGTGTGTTPMDDTSGGVKYVGETQILEELIKNGKRYADGSFHDETQSEAFYNELFHHILRPPKKARLHPRLGLSKESPETRAFNHLSSQIEALLDVLATPNVWIDFSQVEWRLRLGQILWTSSASAEDDFDFGTHVPKDGTPLPTHPATGDERYTERYWLLLQILLATELLLRLDALTDGDEIGLEYVRPAEVHRFEKEANQSVRWTLILARSWLENIEVIRVDEPGEHGGHGKHEDKKAPVEDSAAGTTTSSASSTPARKPGTITLGALAKVRSRETSRKHTIGWISTLTRRLSLADGRVHSVAVPEKKCVYAMRAKHVRRQHHGIAHFARELRWPDESIEHTLQRAANTRESLNTKIPDFSSPTPTASSGHLPIVKSQLEFNRKLPRRRQVVAGLHPGGWLSKSYLSGLMLPGEGLCSLLMASLLESDEAALKALGSVSYLGAGFVYRGKSFWSTACVVGRVLAAGAGSAECMGWVSSDVLPQNRGDGWVNIDVDDVLNDARMTNRRARIWGKVAVERESSVLGDADPASVLPADFVIPYEAVYKDPPPAHTRVALQRFELYTPSERRKQAQAAAADAKGNAKEAAAPAAAPSSAKPPQAKSFFAEMSFSVSSDSAPEDIYTCDLSYDIYFATAHPCVPSRRVKVLKSPSSPTIQQIDVTGNGFSGRANSVHTTGHALHKYYTYASVHLTTLVKNRHKSLEEMLVEYLATTNRAARKTASGTGESPVVARVLVIDCITGFPAQPAAHEMPLSPIMTNRMSLDSSISSFPPLTKEISPIAGLPPTGQPLSASVLEQAQEQVQTPTTRNEPLERPTTATSSTSTQTKMHHETRRRRFGSDVEVLVRAICAEKGWNALISRRRRGCLACAIREAGALGWKVVIRLD